MSKGVKKRSKRQQAMQVATAATNMVAEAQAQQAMAEQKLAIFGAAVRGMGVVVPAALVLAIDEFLKTEANGKALPEVLARVSELAAAHVIVQADTDSVLQTEYDVPEVSNP